MPKDYKIHWNGKRVFTLATEANIRAMKTAAAVVERKTKQLLRIPGTGVEVKKTKSGKVHRRSIPGKPPAAETGILRSSIMSDVRVSGIGVTGKVGTDIDKIAARAAIGTDVNYGLYLEIGTSKMKARPYLRPALRARRRVIKRIFDRANG